MGDVVIFPNLKQFKKEQAQVSLMFFNNDYIGFFDKEDFTSCSAVAFVFSIMQELWDEDEDVNPASIFLRFKLTHAYDDYKVREGVKYFLLESALLDPDDAVLIQEREKLKYMQKAFDGLNE